MRLSHLIAATALLGLCACATETKSPTRTDAEQRSYSRIIERYSDGEAEYKGFYNTFSFRATLHNSTVREALLQKQADYYQWNNDTLLSEREKSEQEMSHSTVAFLSFYTPERRNDNLTESKSIWRVFLDINGQRYTGKVKKAKMTFAELLALYPYHSRWNTAYIVTFDVPTSAVQDTESVVTITGPLGSREVRFPPTER